MASPEARKKKQVDLMLKRSKLEKGARNEAALIKSLKKRSSIVALALRGSIWLFLEKCRCVPKMSFREKNEENSKKIQQGFSKQRPNPYWIFF